MPSGPPAGFDAAKARALAPKVAANIAAKKYDYDRALLKEFQTAAGIAADRNYGGESWGALEHFKPGAPRALFKPLAMVLYKWADLAGGAPSLAPPAAAETAPPAAAPPPPPPSAPAAAPAVPQSSAAPSERPPVGFDSDKARRMAKQVANNLQNKGRDSYSRVLLKEFQTAAGIASDGLYGGSARGALIFYGVPRPPAPYFKPTETIPYKWAAYVQSQGGA